MANQEDKYFETVLAVCKELKEQDLNPVLVGGMALVILGSQRVTRDFDFIISLTDTTIKKVVDVFYGKGFELVSKLNDKGEVLRTIDNKNIAGMRIRLDEPGSVFFYHYEARLKVDLLLDFPFPAADVVKRAREIKVQSGSLPVASVKDLIAMKEMACKDRASSRDAQDLEFLKSLKKA